MCIGIKTEKKKKFKNKKKKKNSKPDIQHTSYLQRAIGTGTHETRLHMYVCIHT